MLRSAELHFFKNYGSHTTINLNSKLDHCFSVIVGRNGSGKSALVDGIIWCLFHRRASSIRAKNTKNLVNKASDTGMMHVIVDIAHDQSGAFNGTRMTISVDILPKCNIPLLEIDDGLNIRSLWNQLLEKCKIPILERILVEQNQAMIAAESALGLLSFIERSVGSESLRVDMEECKATQNAALQRIVIVHKEKDALLIKKKSNEPALRTIEDLYYQRLQLDCRRVASHKWQKMSHAEELQRVSDELDKQVELNVSLLRDMESSASEQQSVMKLETAAIQTLRTAKRNVDGGERRLAALQISGQKERDVLFDLQTKMKRLTRQLSNHQSQSKRHRTAMTECTDRALTLSRDASILQDTINRAESEFTAIVNTHISSTSSSSRVIMSLSEVRMMINEHCLQSSGNISYGESVEQLKSSIIANENMLDSMEAERSRLVGRCEELTQAVRQQELLIVHLQSEFSIGEGTCNENKKRLHAVEMEERTLRREIVMLETSLSSDRRAEGVEAKLLRCRALVASLRGDGALDTRLRGRSDGGEIKNSHCDVIGMLIDCIAVKDQKYVFPFLTVVGVSFAFTMAVRSRDCAIAVGDACRERGVDNVSIDIANECRQGLSTRAFGRADHSPQSPYLVEFTDCLVCSCDAVQAIVSKKIRNWVIFTGPENYESDDECQSVSQELTSALQFLQSGSSGGTAGFMRRNMVTLSGKRFFRDGSIRSSGSPSFDSLRRASGNKRGLSAAGGGWMGLLGPSGGVGKWLRVGLEISGGSNLQRQYGYRGQQGLGGGRGQAVSNEDRRNSVTIRVEELHRRLDEVTREKEAIMNEINSWLNETSISLQEKTKSSRIALKAAQRDLKLSQQDSLDATARLDKERRRIVKSLQSSRAMLREIEKERAAHDMQETASVAFLREVFGEKGCDEIVTLQKRIIDQKLQFAALEADLGSTEGTSRHLAKQISSAEDAISCIQKVSLPDLHSAIALAKKDLQAVSKDIKDAEENVAELQKSVAVAVSEISSIRENKRKVNLSLKRMVQTQVQCLERIEVIQSQKTICLAEMAHTDCLLADRIAQHKLHIAESRSLQQLLTEYFAPSTNTEHHSISTHKQSHTPASRNADIAMSSSGTGAQYGARRKRKRMEVVADSTFTDEPSITRGKHSRSTNTKSTKSSNRKNKKARFTKQSCGEPEASHAGKDGTGDDDFMLADIKQNQPTDVVEEISSTESGECSEGGMDTRRSGGGRDHQGCEEDVDNIVPEDVNSALLDRLESELNSALVESDSESVLDAAKALLTTENEYCSLISHLHVEASHAHQQANALHNKRFDLLVTSLDLIGRHLERIYKTLVPSGECILRYPTDAVCLFTEGISVCVRQQGVGSVATGGRFWEARQLSGGQQATCGLSEVFPSPLYIMDEVDASLDTATAQRLGELIREKSYCGGEHDAIKGSIRSDCHNEQDCEVDEHPESDTGDGTKTKSEHTLCGSQFLIVSHRPEVQENAEELICVYRHCGYPSVMQRCLIDM